jgi:glycosyltransferase involved in cell wall biosynthesis
MEPILLTYLLTALGVWIYRSIRSLSELAQAPALRIPSGNIRKGSVTVLIPARNEEKNIAACVRSFLSQLRESDEIIVINNGSTDRTEAILKDLGTEEIKGSGTFFGTKKDSSAGPFLGYLNTPETPEGWTGKNYALHLGKDYAKGDWLLFTDADTRHEPGSVDAAIAFSETNSLDLLTLLPRCLAHGFWENLIQPCAMGYMGLWFPVRKINDPESKVYFGNGQYLLLRHSHYRKLGCHHAVKEAFLEDFALMRKTKETGAKGICAFGMNLYGTRMYDSFETLWRGWRRIYLHAFEQNPADLLRCVLSTFLFSVLPFAILPFCFGNSLAGILATGLAFIIWITAFKTHTIVKANPVSALFHPLAAAVFTLILADALKMAALKHPTHWR